jgi:hypothetical protein
VKYIDGMVERFGPNSNGSANADADTQMSEDIDVYTSKDIDADMSEDTDVDVSEDIDTDMSEDIDIDNSPDYSSEDDTESWAEHCLSESDLSPSEKLGKIRDGWLCTHFPALLFLNGRRPASIHKNKRGKANRKPISRPFVINLYDMYHVMNLNSPRCAMTAAFDYWIRPHLPTRDSQGDEKKIEWKI